MFIDTSKNGLKQRVILTTKVHNEVVKFFKCVNWSLTVIPLNQNWPVTWSQPKTSSDQTLIRCSCKLACTKYSFFFSLSFSKVYERAYCSTGAIKIAYLYLNIRMLPRNAVLAILVSLQLTNPMLLVVKHWVLCSETGGWGRQPEIIRSHLDSFATGNKTPRATKLFTSKSR